MPFVFDFFRKGLFLISDCNKKRADLKISEMPYDDGPECEP